MATLPSPYTSLSVDSMSYELPNGMVNTIMVTTLTIDKAGRIVLPKPVRDSIAVQQLKPSLI
jgi:hypothetical protein